MNDFTVKLLIALISAVFGALINWLIAEYRAKRDPVAETRRAIERRLAVLLGPYTIDSVTTQADISKIRKDWNAAVDEYALSVNGSLAEISSSIDQYLDSVLLFIRGDLVRAELEAKRQLTAQITIPRVTSIRRRRR